MTTSIQTVTLNPLHIWGSLSQAAQAQVLSHVYPSSATMLGASGAAAPLSYDTIDLLQTFSPIISASGLNAAQQDDLAAALELNAHVTNTDTPGANNALLMPAGAAQVVVDVLVGDANAAAAEANPTNPGLYNEQGVIEGIPGDAVSQARDAVTGALLDLGASGVTASPANPVSDTAGGVAEKQRTPGAEVAASNVPAESLNLTTAEQAAMAEYAAVMANPFSAPAVAAVAARVVTEAAQAAENVPVTDMNLTTTEQVAMAEYAAVMANPATTTAPPVSMETAAIAVAGETAAAVATATAITTAAPETAATNAVAAAAIAATPVTEAVTIAAAPVAATTVPPTITDAEVAAATQELQNLPVTNKVQLTGNLPMAETNVASVQTATAAIAAPVAADFGAIAEVAISPAIVSTVTSAMPAATAATLNTIPVIRFDNARSVLQSLLAEAAAHAKISNPASATYSVGGAMFQMATGADHVQHYIAKNYRPDIPDIIRPIAPVARIRGPTERQT